MQFEYCSTYMVIDGALYLNFIYAFIYAERRAGYIVNQYLRAKIFIIEDINHFCIIF